MKNATLHLILCGFLVVACRPHAPDEAFIIPKNQMSVVVKKANAGDLASIKRLISHYEASPNGDAIAEKWKGKARDLGDSEELYYYAARLFTGARVEADPVKKRDMLAEALKAAEQSSSIHTDASVQKLIGDITHSLKDSQ